jgi:hypothetical protein
MPQAFRLAGYFAARIGKLYHYNVPASIGTNGHDDPGSWELEINPAGVDRLEEEPKIFSLEPGKFGGTLSWYASPKSDREHTDGMMADDAAWVLERCARDRSRPFFLAVGFYRPHTPYVSPKTPYFDMYPEAAMPLVTGVEQDRVEPVVELVIPDPMNPPTPDEVPVAFGRALVVHERNSGYGESFLLGLGNYGNVYIEHHGDRMKSMTERIGWATTATSRGVIIGAVQKAIREDGVFLWSRDAVESLADVIIVARVILVCKRQGGGISVVPASSANVAFVHVPD